MRADKLQILTFLTNENTAFKEKLECIEVSFVVFFPPLLTCCTIKP